MRMAAIVFAHAFLVGGVGCKVQRVRRRWPRNEKAESRWAHLTARRLPPVSLGERVGGVAAAIPRFSHAPVRVSGASAMRRWS